MKDRLSAFTFIFFFLVIGLLPTGLQAENEDRFRNRVNLALRQAAHNLLLVQGDSSTQIPPVEYEDDGSFSIKIENALNYDTLPIMLSSAFADFKINKAYDVHLLDCKDGTLFLGYNSVAVEDGNGTCAGRELTEQCATVVVQFESDDSTAYGQLNAFPKWIILPVFALMLFLLYVRYKRISEKNNSGKLKLGLYSFDPLNQTLLNGEDKTSLTFRESKLLQLFASQPNKVLTRSEIMEVVWEDEGVIVGRSLDVFISRLRKLLNKDPNIQIKNVHGVGYRLESVS